MTETVQHRSRPIDNWRFIAVGIVILSHTFYPRGYLSPVDGEVGVDIFFFISGYVVSQASLRELAATGTFSSSAFYIRRLFRIVPPLVIYLAAVALLGAVGWIRLQPADVIPALANLCNTKFAQCNMYVAHSWTLAFEEQFYLLFPLAFLALSRRARPNLLALSVFAVFAAIPFYLPLHWVGRGGFVVIHALFCAGYLSARYGHWIDRLPAPGVLFFAGLCITFFPVDAFEGEQLASWWRFLYVFSIPAMVLGSASPRFAGRAIFESAALAYLGRISYSIYLWQQLVTHYFVYESPLGIPVNLVLVALMCLACAGLYEAVEKPLIRLGRSLSDTQRGRPALQLRARTSPRAAWK